VLLCRVFLGIRTGHLCTNTTHACENTTHFSLAETQWLYRYFCIWMFIATGENPRFLLVAEIENIASLLY
jgi:hypothetical protein